MNGIKDTLERWTADKSADLYGIHSWGAGYFNISEKGDVVVTPSKNTGKEISNSLMEVISGITSVRL